jgi:hypothetical protein
MAGTTGGANARGRMGHMRTGLTRALVMPALLAVGLALPASALASSPSFTWSGATKIEEEEWSLGGNWEGGTAPKASEQVETLTFPRLTSTACTTERASHSCYFSFNDVPGLSAEAMKLDDGNSYLLAGEELALGKGGLAVAPASGTSGGAADFLELPIHLSAAQKWTVADRSGGGLAENALFLEAPLTGTSALTIEQSNASALFLENDTEVGPVTLAGASATGPHIANGVAVLAGARLNSTDDQAVNLHHIFFAGIGAVGALTTEASTILAGSEVEPAAALEAASAALDPSTTLVLEITGSGTVAQVNYSQLLAKGTVSLGDAVLAVVAHPGGEKAPCPKLTTGEKFTFLSTTGTLSGEFANAPEGGAELKVEFAEGCPEAKKMRISYNRSGATKTVTGEVEAQAQEALEASARELREEAREREDAAQRKVQQEAAAKRTQEEQAAAQKQLEEQAKQSVLAATEGAPAATIAGASLLVSPSGSFTVKITCPAGVSGCEGTVSLRTLNAVVAHRAGASESKAAFLTLASGSFAVPGGTAKAVTLHLSSRARALLARLHTLRARATIAARDAAGATHTARVIVTLRRRR